MAYPYNIILFTNRKKDCCEQIHERMSKKDRTEEKKDRAIPNDSIRVILE